jgi:hypothetical protein
MYAGVRPRKSSLYVSGPLDPAREAEPESWTLSKKRAPWVSETLPVRVVLLILSESLGIIVDVKMTSLARER